MLDSVQVFAALDTSRIDSTCVGATPFTYPIVIPILVIGIVLFVLDIIRMNR